MQQCIQLTGTNRAIGLTIIAPLCLRNCYRARFRLGNIVCHPIELIPGANSSGATPVPIPNTTVKPAAAMVLRKRESSSVPGLKIKNLESKDPRFFLQQIKRGRILLELHA